MPCIHILTQNEAYIKTVDADQISHALAELFQQQVPPQAILAGNDIVLIEVLKFMKENNKQIPGDVAVIAQRAAERLLQQIKKEERTEQLPLIQRFAPAIIVRSSCSSR